MLKSHEAGIEVSIRVNPSLKLFVSSASPPFHSAGENTFLITSRKYEADVFSDTRCL